MSTEKPQETIVNIEDKGEKVKELYLAISPHGDFVVEFVLSSSESILWDLQLRMYNVDNVEDLEKYDYLDKKKAHLDQKNGLSYRKLSEIAASKNTFVKEQTDLIKSLIKSRNKLSLSIAVSDRLKSYKSTVRLLAISCISEYDMTYYPPSSFSNPTPKPGFTIVYLINEDYSIGKEILRLDKCGGIVKLFSKNEDNKKTDKDNFQTIDKYFLVILNVSGIHNHHFEHLNKPTSKIQSLKYHFEHLYKPTSKIQSFYYPKRIYKAIERNKFSAERNLKYFLRCLNKHYFLVDTTKEGAKYMELYDLKTIQLVNTFKRRNLNSSKNNMLDISDNFTISHNNKLLAYKSGNQVKLYLTECGLEIASIILEDGKPFYDYFMHFFINDERLLIYQSKYNWTFWDIFGSVQMSLKLKNPLELDLKFSDILNTNHYQLERSNSFVIVIKNKEEKESFEDKKVYDDLILDYTHLQRKKLDSYYYIIEPWLELGKGAPRYSFYLDKEKEILLLIGNDTIQVWHDRKDKNDQARERILEYISVIDKKNDVKKIEYAIKKFKLTMDSQPVIEIGDDDDVIEACRTFKILNKQVNEVDYFLSSDENRYSKFQKIIKQTQNIIVRFIQLYPTTWRLLDVRYDLLGILIKADEYQLIKYVLFNEKKDIDYSQKRILKTLDYLVSKLEKNELSPDIKPDRDSILHEESLHMPQNSSWEGKQNTISKAYEDPIYLGYLLEYYSNKAVKNIRWMNTVGDILPWLFRKDNVPDVQMVPLIDFVNNKSPEVKGNKFMNFLKSIVLPNKLLYGVCTIPFITLLDCAEYDYNDPFYFNPSMEAIINFMWYSSKSPWLKSLYIFIIYLLSYSIISWMYIAHIQVTGDFQKILGHALFIFLGYASYIGLSQSSTTYKVFNGSTIVYNMTEEKPEDIFTNPFNAIIAAYNWDSILLDGWGFWPLLIISVIGNFIFVIILQNVIISFMSAAFENADKNGKHVILALQSRLICDYANLENSVLTSGKSNLNYKFKDNLRVKYICFYNEPSITKTWKEESKECESSPIYSNIESLKQTEEDESEFFIEKENIKFIWTSADKKAEEAA
ncbi:14161_t:CDS:2 [Dentiscutata erythropus]|uniref:14161_t:CDS:1 n=1 Tax=Dentiscutata erythropus TaxID=1348616 RepID=A0A9N9EHI1_9GLOM|nr:14161_t:CDS:2 [Dentiscutata erythropus]